MVSFQMNEYTMNALLCVIGLVLGIIVLKTEYEYGREQRSLAKNKLVLWMTANTIIVTLTEILYSSLTLLRNPKLYYVMTINCIVNITALAFLSYLWLLYCMVQARYPLEGRKKLCILLAIPFWVVVGMTVLSPFTNMIFRISATDGLYQRGYLSVLPWVIDPLYILAGTVITLKHRRKALNFFPVFVMIGSVAMGAIMQQLTGGMSTIGVSVAVALVELSMSNRTEQAYTDQLTGLYNRHFGITHLKHTLRKANVRGASIIGIEFDLDRFKEINDTYGHGMGDRALRTFAEVLKTIESAVVIRTGGDEFIVFFCGKDLSEADEVIRKVRLQMDAINSSGQHPFAILFSAGAAIYDESMESMESLTAAMDYEMYRMKRQHH